MILGSDVRRLSPPPHVLPDPQKEPPLTGSRKERCSLSGALQLSLKFPVKDTPGSPTGPYRERETPVSRAFFYTFPSKSPVNEPPSMFSNRVLMEREASFLETMVYTFIRICQIRSPPTKNGENVWSTITESRVYGRPTYSGGAA